MATHKPKSKKALPQRNSGPFIAPQLQEDWKRWVDDWRTKLWTWLQTLEKFKDIEQNNYELGHQHLSRGNITDAILRFRFVTTLNPKRANAWYFLGCSYLANKNKNSARDCFEKAIKLNPRYEEANYMLALIGGKSTPPDRLPRNMPLALAREYFDTQAATYNQDQVTVAKYIGHTLLGNAVRSQLVPGRIDHVILELGVGTGLAGPQLRDVAAHITGVDISAPMLSQAMSVVDNKGVKIYDALIHADIESFLRDTPSSGYDVVMAGLVLSYIGDVVFIFQQVARVLKPGGVFVFTADIQESGDYGFDAEIARFRFSEKYVSDLGASSGLVKVKCVETNIYPDYPAWLGIFKK